MLPQTKNKNANKTKQNKQQQQQQQNKSNEKLEESRKDFPQEPSKERWPSGTLVLISGMQNGETIDFCCFKPSTSL